MERNGMAMGQKAYWACISMDGIKEYSLILMAS